MSAVLALLLATQAQADTASDMHSALKQRWDTTEIIVFRNVDAPASESLALTGERLSLAQERSLGTQNQLPGIDLTDDMEPGPATDLAEDVSPFLNRASGTNTSTRNTQRANERTVKVLSSKERPELDAEPWDGILDYDAAPDLGELVARNMATWETQLRARDGKPLSRDELQMNETAEKLGNRRGMEVLLHSGWTQAVPPRDAGTAITLRAGDTYVDPRDGSARSRLEGEVTVTLGRYLHVHPTLFFTGKRAAQPLDQVDQSLRPNSGSDSPDQTQEQSAQQPSGSSRRAPDVRDLSSSSSALDRLRDFTANERYRNTTPQRSRAADVTRELPPYVRLDQSRRVRSGELHYIDHPELGVIVRITPVVAPELLQEQFALLQ